MTKDLLCRHHLEAGTGKLEVKRKRKVSAPQNYCLIQTVFRRDATSQLIAYQPQRINCTDGNLGKIVWKCSDAAYTNSKKDIKKFKKSKRDRIETR